MKSNFEVIEVSPSGKKGWHRGAWCLTWVYSSKGNFLIKGYIQETEDYIKNKNLKCWAIFDLYYKGHKRTIIKTYNCDFEICSPYGSKRKKSIDWKYSIYKRGSFKEAINIKRLPSRFVNFKVKEHVNTGTLSENNSLKTVRDNLSKNE